mmetsp:Transcript_51960/g.149014  ORF Transcript_51960/g.149014 Transcript_51960/m.149014 type:complete len:240 (+) Transcript_51960:173-892(+)
MRNTPLQPRSHRTFKAVPVAEAAKPRLGKQDTNIGRNQPRQRLPRPSQSRLLSKRDFYRRAAMTSACFIFSASCRAVMPSAFFASLSLFGRRARAASTLPPMAAHMRAVMPSWSALEASAPEESSTSTALLWPPCAANMRGVRRPAGSWAFTSALFAMSTWQVTSQPPNEAIMSALTHSSSYVSPGKFVRAVLTFVTSPSLHACRKLETISWSKRIIQMSRPGVSTCVASSEGTRKGMQ